MKNINIHKVILVLFLILYFPFVYYGQLSVSTFLNEDSASAGIVNYMGAFFNLSALIVILGKNGLFSPYLKKGIVYTFVAWEFLAILNSAFFSGDFGRMIKNINYASMWITHFLMYCVIANVNTIKEKRLLLIFALLTLLSSYLVVFIFNARTFYEGRISVGGGLNSSYFVVCLIPWLFMLEKRWLKTSLLIIAVVAVLFSMKRTSILVLSIQLLAFILLREEKRKGFIKKILISIIIIVGLIYLFNYVSDNYLEGGIVSRFEMSEDDNMGGRQSIWELLLYRYNESPFFYQLFGHGCNMFIIDGRVGLTAHNDYLETLYDYGFVGLVILIVFICNLISRIKQVFKYGKNLGIAYITALIAFIVIMMSSHLLFIHPCQIVFLTALWGYAIGISERKIYLK